MMESTVSSNRAVGCEAGNSDSERKRPSDCFIANKQGGITSPLTHFPGCVMIVKRMTGRFLSLVSALCLTAAAQGPVEIDRALLSRALRSEIVTSTSAAQKRTDLVKKAYAAFALTDPDLSRQALMQVLAEFRGVAWTSAHEVASAYRWVVDETVVEPGVSLHATLERWQPGTSERIEVIAAAIAIRNDKGVVVSEPRSRSMEDLANKEFSLKAPMDEGQYALVVELKDAKSGALVARSQAVFWVVAQVRARLAALRDRTEKLAMKSQSDGQAVWANTVLAIAERYSAAVSASLRSAPHLASIMVQTLAPIADIEPLDPASDLAWAQRTLTALESGQDAAKGLHSWVPFAIRSHKDQTLRLARLWWPEEKPIGMIVLLGDALCHDRSWSTARMGSFFALAPSPRPAAGWTVEMWADIDDWIAGIATVSGSEPKPQFLLAHGLSAGDAMQELAGTPTRFAAAALIAGSSNRPLTSLPKGFPPLMLVEGSKDTLVAPDELRRAGLIFQRRLPAAFEYVVAAGETHESVRDASLPRVLEFFSGVSAGTWKPSGTPVPSPRRAPQ